MMELQVRILASELAAALRSHVERRLRLRLGRWADRLGRVAVRISDVASPNGAGGSGKACRISVQLPLSDKTIRRETVDADIYAAIEYATERIGRSVDRELDESEQAAASAKRPSPESNLAKGRSRSRALTPQTSAGRRNDDE